MKTKSASPLFAALATRRPRFLTALVLPLIAAILPLATAHAQTITSAVPGYISYQGKVTNAAGTAVGAGTPVNRTVIFRLWSHSANSTINDLVYAEQQTVTISEGEFSVLIGQGTAVSGTPLGYSESSKGPPTVTFNNSFAVFGGSTRYLGVTVDDGTAAADPEVSPRQQLVTNPYAFRARFAEGLGSNGNFSVAVTDQGNFGVGLANPQFPVTTAATLGDKIGLFGNFNYGIGIQLSTVQIHGASATDDIAFGYGTSAALTETVRFKGNGNVGIGTSNPVTKLDVNGVIGVFDGGSKLRNAGLQTEVGGSLINFGINDSSSNRFGGSYTLADQGGFLRIDSRAYGLFQFMARPANTTTTAEVMTILSNGNVGIGNSAPSAQLHISSGSGSLQVLPGSLNGTANTSAVTLDIPNTGTLSVRDNFVVSGNVGIGTTTPSSMLQIGQGLNQGPGGLLINTGWVNAANYAEARPLDVQIRGSSALVVNTQGNVGVGTSAPATALDVNGTVRAAAHLSNTSVATHEQGAWLEWNKAGGDGAAYLLNQKGLGPGGIVFAEVSTANTMTERMRINSSGYVGIGTSAPASPLHVAGSATYTFNVEAWGNTGGWADLPNQAQTLALGAIIDSGIRAFGFYVNSDARIKQVQGKSSGADDLATLQKIEVTDYVFRDKITYGARAQKKAIAQQLEQVFPLAVGRATGVVSDIFQKAGTADGWVELETDLKIGERVRLIAEGKQEVHEVIAVQPGRFRTAFKPAGDKVFVYGREVNDFRSVDYEAISMLNVSATQEIKREKDAEVAALTAANAALTARVAELEAKDRARDAKLASIEKLLQSSQTVMARPSAAPRANGSGQE